MNSTSRLLLLAADIAVPLVAFFARRQSDEGVAEQAGSAFDSTVQKMKDAVDPPGPMEKMGRSVDNAVQ